MVMPLQKVRLNNRVKLISSKNRKAKVGKNLEDSIKEADHTNPEVRDTIDKEGTN